MKRVAAALFALLLWPLAAQAGSSTIGVTAGSGTLADVTTDASAHIVPWSVLCDAAAAAQCATVKAGSTAAVAGDPSVVMQLSPNSLGGASGTPLFASITNASIAVTGTFWQTTQPVSLASLPAYTNSSTVTIGKVDNLGNAGAIIDFAGQNATVPANAWLVGCGFNTSPTTISSGSASPLGCDNKDNLLVNLNAGVGTAAGNGLFVTPATSAIFEVSPTTAANTSSNPFFSELSDGTHTNTIKAASTQSVAGDTSVVVQLNPNQPNLTTALNVSAAPASATAWGIFTNGSTSSGQSGVLGMAAVTTAAPTYTNAQTAWLSQTTGGGLRADIASVVGTAASTAASGVLKVGVVGNTGATVDAALGSASTNAVLVQGAASGTAINVTGHAGTAVDAALGSATTNAVTVQGASGMTAVNNLAQAATANTNSGYANTATATLTTTSSHSYSAGNALGGLTTFTITGNNGQTGYVTEFGVGSVTGQTFSVWTYLFNASPSTSCTDGSAFSPAAADLDKEIAIPQLITLAAPAGSTPSQAEATFTPPHPFAAGASAKTIYACIVLNGSYSSPASSTADEHIRVGYMLN